MSVLNQSGEEQVECPLCMEPLEVDDLNFFPCTCGYQICRFCWHRIRTDENGLCPACRKAYSENPADFTPLSKEQVAQLKAEKRQRDQQRKAKLSESRKHLASVRVVQRNLVFVVGLPMRLADPEVLKRHEYFGKFGKIHKVVINQSPSYAGTQGPSASAYVTYMKSDDALRAIQSVNNITIDGRLIKSSLGTTKYCSHFMKNLPCPKPDCMYLHDFGDPEASFTKEQMHAGKHQEYEKKLHEALLAKMNSAAAAATANNGTTPSALTATATATTNQQQPSQSENGAKPTAKTKEQQQPQQQQQQTNGTNKENWPHLNQEKQTKAETKAGKNGGKSSKSGGKAGSGSSNGTNNNNNNCTDKKGAKSSCEEVCDKKMEEKMVNGEAKQSSPILDDNDSFFSRNSFQKLLPDPVIENHAHQQQHHPPPEAGSVLGESLPDFNTTEDWEAAFGFSKYSNHLEELARQRAAPKNTFVNQEGGGSGLLDALVNSKNGFAKYLNGMDPQGYLMVQHRQQIEEQLLGLSLKSGYANCSLNTRQAPYMNGDSLYNGLGALNGGYQPENNVGKHGEDELDFDPFQEMQKALAELIENEQNHKLHSNSSNVGIQLNNHVNGQGIGNQLPPPPPGFVQPQHMNSFGSKILPYLNMGSSNQQPQQLGMNSSQHNNWPGSYGQIQQQHKGLGTCNDWKVLDPAIVSSSKHFPLSNLPPRDPYSPLQHLGNPGHIANGQLRSGYDYQNTAFTNFTQHIQPNLNNFTSHLAASQHFSWLGNELNTQISSPPGFRSASQNTKQQEC